MGLFHSSTTVPFYCWSTAQTSANISEGQTVVPLDVSVTRSGPVDPELLMQCVNYRLLNASFDSKLSWICTEIIIITLPICTVCYDIEGFSVLLYFGMALPLITFIAMPAMIQSLHAYLCILYS